MKSTRRKIELKDGRSLWACYSLAAAPTADWVAFVPESGSEFLSGNRAELSRLLGRSMASRFNYLAINKPGWGPKGCDREAFERSFRRYRRVEDAVATLRAIVPARGRIYLIGYSEGAYLAPQIARRDRRVKSVIMIGGGTRGWLKEELSNARGARGKAELQRQLREIRARSRSTEKWNGFSYATWHSYREDSTLHALRELDMPVLSILGARDSVIDLKAALKDLKALSKKKPIQTDVLKTCGHEFSGKWHHVQASISDFLHTLDFE